MTSKDDFCEYIVLIHDNYDFDFDSEQYAFVARGNTEDDARSQLDKIDELIDDEEMYDQFNVLFRNGIGKTDDDVTMFVPSLEHCKIIHSPKEFVAKLRKSLKYFKKHEEPRRLVEREMYEDMLEEKYASLPKEYETNTTKYFDDGLNIRLISYGLKELLVDRNDNDTKRKRSYIADFDESFGEYILDDKPDFWPVSVEYGEREKDLVALYRATADDSSEVSDALYENSDFTWFWMSGLEVIGKDRPFDFSFKTVKEMSENYKNENDELLSEIESNVGDVVSAVEELSKDEYELSSLEMLLVKQYLFKILKQTSKENIDKFNESANKLIEE